MRFLKLAPAVLIGSLAITSTASAQAQKGFAIDRFNPSERGSEWFVMDSLDLRGHGRISAGGVVGAWAYKPLVVYDINGNEISQLIRHQVFVHPGASVTLWDRLRVSTSLPIALFQNGKSLSANDKTYTAPEGAIGDLRLSADARLFGEYGKPVTLAAGGELYFPTGSRVNYTSDGTVRFTPRVQVAGDISIFTYAANAGFAIRPLDETYDRNPLGHEVVFGAAAGARLANKKLVVGPELWATSIVDSDSFLKRRGTPIEALLGAHYSISDFRFGGGMGTGLTRGWGTPELRAMASAEWTPSFSGDNDNDGVRNDDDACPNVAGVRTNDKKTNGCPPKREPPPNLSDRDGDTILDQEDACPDLAGVRSYDAKKNGCPSDRDGDGVYDLTDACPDLAGPPNSEPSKNGCPNDRDGDQIADDKDACPDAAGEKSDDPTKNGCPSDRDEDGIADKEDACPDAAGPADTDPKRNGCPLARIENGQIRIVEQVKFKTNSAEILRDSDPTLLAIAMTLKSHPEITKLRIEGHTDNTGTIRRNIELSRERANAVMKWLVSFGLEKKRFEAKGLGAQNPIDSNATEEGRQNNRRVELHIVDGNAPTPPAKPEGATKPPPAAPKPAPAAPKTAPAAPATNPSMLPPPDSSKPPATPIHLLRDQEPSPKQKRSPKR